MENDVEMNDISATPFLGVSNSVSSRTWMENLNLSQQSQAIAISQQYSLSEVIGRVLAARNVELDDIPNFLEPKFKDFMPDPSTITDMDQVCERLYNALVNGEKIGIIGDYDVDGATSVALLGKFLKFVGSDFVFHIPDRVIDGYGPSVSAIHMLKQQGITLIVTLDCGSIAFEEFDEAKKLGLDVVVIDHHQLSEVLPETKGLINPKREDDVSELEYLATVGLTFLFLVALNRKLRESGYYKNGQPDLMEWLDVVALGTICDVVPLKGLNRVFVKQGLQCIHKRRNLGMSALCDVIKFQGLVATNHLGYHLGPRINAGGRIGDPRLGTELLLSENVNDSIDNARKLDDLNKLRQQMEIEMLEQGKVQAEKMMLKNPDIPVVVVESDAWHPGIVGLIASRIRETYSRPAFAIYFDKDGVGQGSGRSIEGVDIGNIVQSAVDKEILLKGGGHAMAAGIKVDRENLTEFIEFASKSLMDEVQSAKKYTHTLRVDGAISASGATLDFYELLESVGPYGAGHSEPIFVFPSHTLKSAFVVGKGFVKVELESADGVRINGISFQSAEKPIGKFLLNSIGSNIHVACMLSLNFWNGRKSVEFRLVDVADPKVQKTQ